jgi:hypothetical protein
MDALIHWFIDSLIHPFLGSVVHTISWVWTPSCYFIGISTTICSFTTSTCHGFCMSKTSYTPLMSYSLLQCLEISAVARPGIGAQPPFFENIRVLWGALGCFPTTNASRKSQFATGFCCVSLSGNNKAKGNNKAGSSAKLAGLPSVYEWRFRGCCHATWFCPKINKILYPQI